MPRAVIEQYIPRLDRRCAILPLLAPADAAHQCKVFEHALTVAASRAQTAIRVLYVRSLGGTRSADMRRSTDSASATRPAAACTLIRLVYARESAVPPPKVSASKYRTPRSGASHRNAADMPAVANLASTGIFRASSLLRTSWTVNGEFARSNATPERWRIVLKTASPRSAPPSRSSRRWERREVSAVEESRACSPRAIACSSDAHGPSCVVPAQS